MPFYMSVISLLIFKSETRTFRPPPSTVRPQSSLPMQGKPDLCRDLCAHPPPWKSRPCAEEKGGKGARGASLQGTGLFSQ